MNKEKKIIKEIREARKTLRKDYEKIGEDFRNIVIKMDEYLEVLGNSLKGGKKK